MFQLSPRDLLRLLLAAIAVLSTQFVLVVAAGAWLQVRRNRLNRLRIACHRRWESDIVAYLYGDGDPAPFRGLGPEERRLFMAFLLRILRTLSGTEGEAVQRLYAQLGLAGGLDRRLRSRRPTQRALAALEAGSFGQAAHFPRLQALLRDPVPHVAHAAARGLAGTGRLAFAEPVLAWVLGQEAFQHERLLWILEGFGPGLLPWMEQRLAAADAPDPRECVIYAQLAASGRNVQDLSWLLAMLRLEDAEARTAALKALGAIGNPEALEAVLPFAHDPSWVLRGQAAKALGALAGPGAIPDLLDLMADPVFEVRRNAARALAGLGPAGREALAWLADDPQADPFARDLALERLQWLPVEQPA